MKLDCYVRWRAKILQLLKAIMNSLFWVIVESLFVFVSWNFMLEYFFNSLGLEIDFFFLDK